MPDDALDHAAPKRFSSRLLAAVFLSFAGALAIRYGLMQSDTLGALCAGGTDDCRCALRTWLPQLFIDQRIGWLALASGALALLSGSRPFARIALLSGAAGLVLYSTDYAAAGLLLGLLVLVSPPRVSAEPKPE
jgi:hypothetical protein